MRQNLALLPLTNTSENAIIRATETTLQPKIVVFLSLDTLFDVSIAQLTPKCDAVSLQLSALSV